jgi:PIN domain nuclease of toxin-antitoxin system
MVLLDTHAILWLDNGDPLSDRAHQAIRQAAASGGVLVSPGIGMGTGAAG